MTKNDLLVDLLAAFFTVLVFSSPLLMLFMIHDTNNTPRFKSYRMARSECVLKMKSQIDQETLVCEQNRWLNGGCRKEIEKHFCEEKYLSDLPF